MTAYLNALGVICALGRDKQEVARNLFAGDCSGMRSEAGWVAERVVAGGARCAANWRRFPPNWPSKAAATTNCCWKPRCRFATTSTRRSRPTAATASASCWAPAPRASTKPAGAWPITFASMQFPADYDYQQQELGAPANFLADWLQLSGPAYVISTACTSSARALMSAQRLLDLGLCDAVLCGGVDTLVQADPQRFLGAGSGVRATLQSVFGEPQRHQYRRSGRAVPDEQTAGDSQPIALLGSGASSDAHHISAPEPTGRGALQAMRKALSRAEPATRADRLPEPARHRHPAQRRHGKPGGGGAVPGTACPVRRPNR